MGLKYRDGIEWMLKYFHLPGLNTCVSALQTQAPVDAREPWLEGVLCISCSREGCWAGVLTARSTAPLPRDTAWLWQFPGIETSNGGMKTHTCMQARVSELASRSSSFSSRSLALAVSSGCCSSWGRTLVFRHLVQSQL